MKALYSNEKVSCFWLHLVTFWAWVRYGTHDLFDLVDSGSPRKQSFTLKHLSQDAAQAPHVHTFGVPLDNRYWLTIDLENTIISRFGCDKWWRHLADPSRISGARYQRVATYSVSAGLQLSSWNCLSDLARPKSQSLTTQSVSNSTLDGCGEYMRKGYLSPGQTVEISHQAAACCLLARIFQKYFKTTSVSADVPFGPCG